MEEQYQIRDLNEVLRSHINNHLTMLEYSTTRLTEAGENYGSLMLRLDIKLRNNKSGETEDLHLVAKMSPPNEWIKKMFNIPVTFKREIGFYKDIIPALQAFQRRQGVSNVIDCFPECYGARTSLNPASDEVDDDALLLLQNLKPDGFVIMDRMEGFDLQTAELLLKDLAVFHAVPIALKMLDPETFKEKVMVHLKRVRMFDDVSEFAESKIVDRMVETAAADERCVPILPSIRKALERCAEHLKNRPLPAEPFATINHNDYWVNNTLVKFENGKPRKNKMVDFQIMEYDSPGNDIVFFLFSSVQAEVLDQHYDDLVKLYHSTFVATLASLKCDTAPFTYEKLLEEIASSARTTQFFHVMIMLRPIFTKKESAKEISELCEEDLMSDDNLSDMYSRKVPEKALQFAKRGFL